MVKVKAKYVLLEMHELLRDAYGGGGTELRTLSRRPAKHLQPQLVRLR
jgi:hypothetical protein